MDDASKVLRFSAVAFATALLAACGSDKFENETPASVDPVAEAGVTEDASESDGESLASPAAEKLIDLCMEEGEIYEICSCQIAAVENALGEDDFAELLALVDAGDEEAGSRFLGDIGTNKPDVAMKMATDMLGCTSN